MSPRRPLLFDRYPALQSHLGFEPLADRLPTPVEPLPGLAEQWGIGELWVKRDDQTSSLYGGNKVRKLEWLLAAAQRAGRRAVITTGAWGSHHALATALFAREVGSRATLVLFPQPPNPHVRDNYLLDVAAGARIVCAASVATVPVALARGRLAARFAGEGWPYAIAAGGSDRHGTLGYVEAGLELAAQIQAGQMPAPDYVYVAAGTCGTAAGLALGLELAAAEVPELAATHVVAVRVVPGVLANRRRIRSLIRQAARLLVAGGARLPEPAVERAVQLVTDQVGRGYGHPTRAAEQARTEAAELDRLEVDPTYTAKALAGLREFASDPERRHARHLYLHTLGMSPPIPSLDPEILPRALRRLDS